MKQSKFFLLTLFLSCSLSAFSAEEVSNTRVDFFSASVTVQYDPGMDFKFRACPRDKCLKDFFETMEQTNYQILLDDLLKQKEELQLNDWFFYKLVRKSVEKIHTKQSEIYHTMVCWFLFTKAGYDTQLNTSINKYVFLTVATKDKVFNAPFLKIDGKTYINLTALYFGLNTRRAVYELPNYEAPKGTKTFSFDINQLPKIPARTIKKTVKFKYINKPYSIAIEVDTMAGVLMRDYPVINDENYFKVAPSKQLKTSLLSQLSPFLEGKTEQEKVEFLVAFTRTAFKYKFDEDIYSYNQPMIPEELFMYKYSDHEDRCSILYFLLQELSSLDMIPIRYYDTYLTIAVALPTPIGDPIDYNGKTYFVCDPISPTNSKKLGVFPNGMTYETMAIVEGF